MLGWLTFAAAALAALGAIVGPVVAYRATTKTLAANAEAAARAQQQAMVDRYIDQAVGTNKVAASFAVSQLDYLLSTGDLTPEQTTAAYNAIEASLSGLRRAIESAGVDPQVDNGSEDHSRDGGADE